MRCRLEKRKLRGVGLLNRTLLQTLGEEQIDWNFPHTFLSWKI
jgi:hypothetical protein